MSKWKVQHFVSQSSETCKCQTVLRADLLYQILPKLVSKCLCTGRNTCKPLSKGFHLMKFAHSKCLWTSPVPNFIQNLQKKIVENMEKLLFRHWSEVWLHCTDFYKTHTCSAALHGDFLHQISPKWIKKYGKYRQKFVCVLSWSMAVTKPSFTELMFAW